MSIRACHQCPRAPPHRPPTRHLLTLAPATRRADYARPERTVGDAEARHVAGTADGEPGRRAKPERAPHEQQRPAADGLRAPGHELEVRLRSTTAASARPRRSTHRPAPSTHGR